MTEERTGNNSPGVWHRHLCVLWAQVDSCLMSPPSPSLSLAPPECGRRGSRGQGETLLGSINSAEKCFELWLWSWITSHGRGLMWVSAWPRLIWPARASDETFFVLTVQQKSLPPAPCGLWSAPFCSTFYPGLAYLSPGRGNVANINYHMECVNACNLRMPLPRPDIVTSLDMGCLYPHICLFVSPFQIFC